MQSELISSETLHTADSPGFGGVLNLSLRKNVRILLLISGIRCLIICIVLATACSLAANWAGVKSSLGLGTPGITRLRAAGDLASACARDRACAAAFCSTLRCAA